MRVRTGTGAETPLSQLHPAPILKCHLAGGLQLQERWRFSTCSAAWRPPKVVTTLREVRIATDGNIQLAQLAADKRMQRLQTTHSLGSRNQSAEVADRPQ